MGSTRTENEDSARGVEHTPPLPVAILAGGLATRLRPLTESMPKSLIDVAGRPFVAHQMELLASRGIERVVLCLGYLGEQVRETVGDGSRYGVTVEYSFDGDELLGTAGALVHARELLGDAFLVLYGDSYLEIDYLRVQEAFLAGGRPGLMTVFRNDQSWDRSNVLFADGRIVSYDKSSPHPEARHIDFGLGALRAEALDLVGAVRPADLAALYGALLERGELDAFEVGQRFYEIGSDEGLAELRAHLFAVSQPS